MRFAYMDETGNTGRRFDDPDQPIHMIVSLVVDESKVTDLHEHIREVGRRHCAGDCDEAEFEFHGGDLFSGDNPFGGHSCSRSSRSSGWPANATAMCCWSPMRPKK